MIPRGVIIPLLDVRPKNKRFVCPFGLKIGRVGRSIFFSFFFFNLDTEEMQYHSCVCIPGLRSNWFNPGNGGGCIPLYLVKVPFRDSYCIFLTFYFKIFV